MIRRRWRRRNEPASGISHERARALGRPSARPPPLTRFLPKSKEQRVRKGHRSTTRAAARGGRVSHNTLGRLFSKRLYLGFRVALISVVVVAVSVWPRGAAAVGPIVVNESSDTLHNGMAECANTGTGTCSLRDAITFANSNAGADTINFNIDTMTDPGCVSGVCTIALGSSLPDITGPVTIDGYTQTGASANTNGPLMGDNAALKIEIDGTNITCCALHACLEFTSGSGGSTVKGLVINRCHASGVQFASTGAATRSKAISSVLSRPAPSRTVSMTQGWPPKTNPTT